MQPWAIGSLQGWTWTGVMTRNGPGGAEVGAGGAGSHCDSRDRFQPYLTVRALAGSCGSANLRTPRTPRIESPRTIRSPPEASVKA